jgi:hypothetical protein
VLLGEAVLQGWYQQTSATDGLLIAGQNPASSTDAAGALLDKLM